MDLVSRNLLQHHDFLKISTPITSWKDKKKLFKIASTNNQQTKANSTITILVGTNTLNSGVILFNFHSSPFE